MPFKSSLGSLVYAVTMLAILRFATSLSLHRPTISSTPATPHASPQPPSSASTVAAPATRRQWLKAPVLPGLAALIASVVLTPETTLAADPRCVEQSDPFKTIKRCYRVGLDKDGRLRPIAADENGISCSSVRNPSRFSPPWNYKRDAQFGNKPSNYGAANAWADLKKELEATPGVEIQEDPSSSGGGYYLHATAPASVPPGSTDDLEFTLNEAERLVLYRSVSRDSVFVYPLQQPVADRGAHAARLEDLRSRLGWARLSYDTEEGNY